MKVLPRLHKAVLLNSALGVVLIAAVGGAYAVVATSDSGSPKRTDTRTAAVSTGKVQATVAGSGLLASPSDAGVSFTTGGQLTRVEVKPGDKVTKGQLLAKVDDKPAREAVTQAKTALAAAKANLASVQAGQPASPPATPGTNPTGKSSAPASATPKPTPTPPVSPTPTPPATPTPTPTPKSLTGAAAELSLDEGSPLRMEPIAHSVVDPNLLIQAQAQAAQAQSTLDAAQRALEGTVLTAPVDGTVASVGATVGQTVIGTTYASGAGTPPGAPAPAASNAPAPGGTSAAPSGFIVLTNPTGMQVKANVPEADALRLRPGQAATVTLTAQSTTTLNAKVLTVGTLAVSGPGAGGTAAQYPVTLDIMGPTTDLHTGQGVSVQIVAGEASDALFVPTAALSGSGVKRTVTVVAADGTAHSAQVTVGVESDTNTQITSGLTQGQKVRITTVAP
ncbi:efflux RND transporter periplasmic adaptor subunit [Streptomyces sp. NPDC006530]|uniref:efflux RND transporter periplasmic adaptor subunit n=1 Tax=Streptomyces sp. NPDC006530 TaxID=3364750 RepID=UPI0036A10A30